MTNFENEFLEGANRIVVTESYPYNPKSKKNNKVLADIREPIEIEKLKPCLKIDTDSHGGHWMSPIDIYLNSMNDKAVLFSVGVVLGIWLRHEGWESDFILKNDKEFIHWLSKHGVKSYEKEA